MGPGLRRGDGGVEREPRREWVQGLSPCHVIPDSIRDGGLYISSTFTTRRSPSSRKVRSAWRGVSASCQPVSRS